MNRRERRAMHLRRYPQAQYHAIMHDYRLARYNLTQMLDGIAKYRNPLMAQFYHDPIQE